MCVRAPLGAGVCSMWLGSAPDGRPSASRRSSTGARRTRGGGGPTSSSTTRTRTTGSCSTGAVLLSVVDRGGVVVHDPTDATDFRLTAYELRRARPRTRCSTRSSPTASPPRQVTASGRRGPAGVLGYPVVRRGADAMAQMSAAIFGGWRSGSDMSRIGANALWPTPVFPAESKHRYNASTFDRSDPLLGGDAALVELLEPRTRGGCTGAQQASTISDLEPAHARGMHLVGDLTPKPAATPTTGSGPRRQIPTASRPASTGSGTIPTTTGRGPASRRCRRSTTAVRSCADGFGRGRTRTWPAGYEGRRRSTVGASTSRT